MKDNRIKRVNKKLFKLYLVKSYLHQIAFGELTKRLTEVKLFDDLIALYPDGFTQYGNTFEFNIDPYKVIQSSPKYLK